MTAVERRRAEACRLRDEEGISVRAIARRLKVATSTAHGYLKAGPPERPGSPVPNHAEAGNWRTLKHGLDSQRVLEGVIQPRGQELAREIVDAHSHLDTVRDGSAVLRYGINLARLEYAYAWLTEQADELFSDRQKGRVHGLYSRLERWETQASRDEERLAISPRERTRLKLDQVKGRLLLGEVGQRADLSRLSDEELEQYRRLLEKAELAGR